MQSEKKSVMLINIIMLIVLIVLVVIVIKTDTFGLLDFSSIQTYESFKTKLEDAACVYVETKMTDEERKNCKENSCIITFDNLVESGYISKNIKDPSINQKASTNSQNYNINVSWEKDVKNCTFIDINDNSTTEDNSNQNSSSNTNDNSNNSNNSNTNDNSNNNNNSNTNDNSSGTTSEQSCKNLDIAMTQGDKLNIYNKIGISSDNTFEFIVKPNNQVISIDTSGNISATSIGTINFSIQVKGVKYCIKVTVTAAVTSPEVSSTMKISFLSTQGGTSSSGTLVTGNESIIIESNGEYALLDTGTPDICSKIKQKIHNFTSNSGTVTLKYLIISHSHEDHYGCATTLLNSSDIKVENLVIKYESKRSYVYENITSVAKTKGVNIIKANDLSEGSFLSLGNIKLDLYNNSDIYSSYTSSACKKTINTLYLYVLSKNQVANAEQYANNYVKINDQFIVFNGRKMELTTEFIRNKGQTESDSTFYAKRHEVTSICNPNANSIAVLVNIPTTSGTKYIYLPSDLENNGYSMFGSTYDNVTVYGNGLEFGYRYENDSFVMYESNGSYRLYQDENRIQIPQEYIIAKRIKTKLGNNVNNIIIYQASHHGENVDPASISLLNLNRSNVYSIYLCYETPATQLKNLIIRSLKTTLSNTQVYYTGAGDIEFEILSNGTVNKSRSIDIKR